MASSKSVCRTIVMVKGEYFVADRRDIWGGWKPRFSTSPFDAKAFKTEKDAHEKARKLHGCVRLFDAINGVFI